MSQSSVTLPARTPNKLSVQPPDTAAAVSATRRNGVAAGFAGPPPTAGDRLAGPAVATDARRWVQRGGVTLVCTLLIAQAVFVTYLLGSYGRTTLLGNVAAWTEFSAKGWVPGDTAGNAAMVSHIVVAVLVLVTGALQLTPVVRRRAPRVHRWSGRVYVAGCMIGAVSGLALVWGRGTVGDLSQHVAISINAVVLLACAVLAWRAARARDMTAHRAWAMRTFATANGVLYFRLFLALWLVVFRAPVGFDPNTFSGPFLTALAFTVYVFGPLLVYELYRTGARTPRRTVQGMVAGVLFSLAAVIVAGTLSAWVVLWLPRLGG